MSKKIEFTKDHEIACHKLAELIGAEVYLPEDERKWAEITGISFYDGEFWLDWAQYEEGQDLRDIINDGAFPISDIGKKAFFGNDSIKKFKELEAEAARKAEAEAKTGYEIYKAAEDGINEWFKKHGY